MGTLLPAPVGNAEAGGAGKCMSVPGTAVPLKRNRDVAPSPPIPTVTVDAQLRPSALPPGPAYWNPEETEACGLICADPQLPGVGNWLDGDERNSVYRLIPWYPFAGGSGNWVSRRKSLLAAVRDGNHVPVIRVDPTRPWTVSLATSLLSPVLEHPDGPDSADADAETMWWESIIPVGCLHCTGLILGPPERLPLAACK